MAITFGIEDGEILLDINGKRIGRLQSIELSQTVDKPLTLRIVQFAFSQKDKRELDMADLEWELELMQHIPNLTVQHLTFEESNAVDR